MIVKGLCISDLHLGLAATPRFYEELQIVKDYIEHNDLDIIHINGDYFDRKLSFGEPAALIAMQFFNEIRALCIKKHIKLRVIHGTEGHERMQTEMFKSFESPQLDMQVYSTVTEEEVFPDFKVLFVPEEYPLNADEFYAPYKQKEYAAIMGHGMWDFAAKAKAVIEEGDRIDVKTAPVFKFDEWQNCLKHGFAMFGHIHTRMHKKHKVFYPGSFSAWDFTDISKKGFSVYTYDTNKKYYKITMIDNTMCPTYSTINITDLGLDLENCSIQDIQSAIEPFAAQTDFFRLDISAKDIPADKLEIIKRAINNTDSNISIKIDNKRKILRESIDEEAYAKYDYLLKNSLKIDEAILKFIKEDLIDHANAGTITLEDVTEIISEEGK